MGCNQGIRTVQTIDASFPVNVTNSIICYCNVGFQAVVLGDIVENYNSVFGNNTARSNVNTGANSDTKPAIFAMPLLLGGYQLPAPSSTSLSPYSPIRAIAGSGEASEDLYGMTRPTTSSKKSRGSLQFVDTSRETGTTRTGGVSIKMTDAGRYQVLVPVTNVSTTISVYVHREADYAGTLPQMVIKQPGQSDRTTTDTGSASQFNQLTDTFTPSAGTDFVVVELVSNNTATSGNYDIFFDDLDVS
jgi:hypothetical protein